MSPMTKLKEAGMALTKFTKFVPEVKHTTNFEQFNIMPGNRPVTEYHVRELVESYKNNPNLVELRPILVNERLEIVDGQHRLRACEILGIEMPYIVAPGLTVATAQIMNALQRNWQLVDFAHSYAYSGAVDYQQFEHFMDEYGLNPHIVLCYVRNTPRPGGTSLRNFKLGNFTMDDEQRRATEERLSKLSMFDDYKLPWRTSRFAKAVLEVMQVEGYDHDRMMRNLALAAPTIKPQADRKEWMRELERVYNYNIKSDANILRFF